MKLTPLDIHHKEFRNSLRGYNSEQVDDFLDEVADEFERLFKENIDLSEKMDAANERIRAYGELEHTLQNTLVAAQTSAQDITARARAEADKLRRDAEAKAQEVVSAALEEKQASQVEYARLQAAEQEFRTRFRHMLETYLANVGGQGMEDEAAAVASMSAPARMERRAADEIDDLPVARADVAPESADEPAAADPAESVAVTGAVVGLTLGEIGDSPMIEDDVPSLDVPEEFMLPPRGAVGELDDLDIEEID
jgi:cell division initiation protein